MIGQNGCERTAVRFTAALTIAIRCFLVCSSGSEVFPYLSHVLTSTIQGLSGEARVKICRCLSLCCFAMTGLFLSDLHLFSRRSVGQLHWDRHRDAIAAADVVVLGGDIFDIRWSQMGSLDTTLKAAEGWLHDAISLNPGAAWMYLLGNHDCHPRLQSILQTVADKQANFSWTPDVWRHGNNLFLHGDVLDGHQNLGGLDAYRATFHEDHPRGSFGNLMYSAVIETRLHGVIPRWRHTHPKTCRKLIQYLESQRPDTLNGVQNIFFGHTHVAISNYRFERYLFHNAGSGIRHLNFAPAPFEVMHVRDR